MNEGNHLYAYLVEGDKKTLMCIDNCCEEDRNQTFVCPGCGGEVGLRMGDIRRWHFYHKTECNCPGETYKHMVTKELFKKYFYIADTMRVNNKYEYECEHKDNCKIIDLWRESNNCKKMIPSACYTIYKNNIFDLKKYYDTADIEKHEDKYIADVLLTGEKAPDMLIEIKVTHKCTEEKQNSGYKIIEIDVSDMDESEIEDHFLLVASGKANLDEAFDVKFYGMKKTDGKSPERVMYSDISKSGRYREKNLRDKCTCEEYERRANLYLPGKRREKERKKKLEARRIIEYADQERAWKEFNEKFKMDFVNLESGGWGNEMDNREEQKKEEENVDCPKTTENGSLHPICERCIEHPEEQHKCWWETWNVEKEPKEEPKHKETWQFKPHKPKGHTVRRTGDDGRFYYEVLDDNEKVIRRYKLDDVGNRVDF